MRGVLVVCLLAACGRFGFEEREPVTHDWLSVDTGGDGTCAITITGELWCWGLGDSGNLGNGVELLRPIARVGDAVDWSTVQVGGTVTCGLRSDQSLWCWGTNASGELPGLAPDVIVETPMRIGPGAWLALSVNNQHGCAIDASRTLQCWGEGESGVLGNGRTDPIAPLAPVVAVGTNQWNVVSSAAFSTCGIQTDNSLWCWGLNTDGEVGDGSQQQRSAPVRVGAGTIWIDVAAGDDHTCALEQGGQVWCWGRNTVGQVGTGTVNARQLTPTRATTVPPLVSIESGRAHTCGETAAGEVYCWGNAEHGQFGRTLPLSASAIRVAPLARDLTAGGDVTCYVDDAAALYCTGANSFGQAGGPAGIALVPEQADTRTDWARIVAGGNHACALTRQDELHCWGLNNFGELGIAVPEDVQVPRTTSMTFPTVSVGSFTVAMIASNGAAWLSGLLPDQATRWLVPMMFTIPGSAKSFSVGDEHGCRIRNDDALVCGGSNTFGQLGDGTMTNNPATIVAGSYRLVGAGGRSTCAVTIGEELMCWGSNRAGKLGIGSTTTQPTPQPVNTSGMSGIIEDIAMGTQFTCTRNNAGEIWCWGDGGAGQLGNGTPSGSLTPTRLGADSDWSKVTAGDLHACALKRDNTLWCWGHADRGQAGPALGAALTLPVRIGAAEWRDVAAGNHFTCAIKLDGTRWCFGNNETGELGNGRAWLEQFTVIP